MVLADSDVRAMTAREALDLELATGRTVTEMLGGVQACVTCRGAPPAGYSCLRCGAARSA